MLTNYKQAWIKVPRGSVMDSGFESEQEAFDYYQVDNKADLEKAFLEAFPNEYYWFQITSITYETHQMLQLGDLTFYLTNGEIDCYSDKYRYCDLFVWMIDSLEEVIKECEAGTYNDRIEKELPYELRYGVISRKLLWDHNPKYRESNLQDLTKEEIDRFIAILEEEGGQCPTERLKSITFNRYFRYASANTIFADRAMVSEIGKDIRAKVEFINTSVSKHYDALKLSIINRTEGMVDSHVFKFSDIIGVKGGTQPHIWENDNRVGWYMYSPTYSDLQEIQSKVESYIGMYADQQMDTTSGMRMENL